MSEEWKGVAEVFRRVQGAADGFVEWLPEDVEQSVPERLEHVVALYGERVALTSLDGELTYDQLNARANQLAWAILDRVGPDEEPVVQVLGNGIAGTVGIFGLMKAGKMYVPLDLANPRERTDYILKDSGARLMVTDGTHLSRAREMADDKVELLSIDDLGLSARTDDPGLPISPDRLVFIIYTSGSTGRPKGVVQTHRSILHDAAVETNECLISPDDRLLMVMSLGFSGHIRYLYGALLNGACLCPYDVKGRGVSGLAEWVRGERITMYTGLSTFRGFAASLKDGERIEGLRCIKFGGDTLYRDNVEVGRAVAGPDAIMCMSLASTEAGSIAHYCYDSSMPLDELVLPCGHAVDDVEVLIVDEGGEPVAPGQEGEMWVRSRYVSPGYWGRPDLTEGTFLPDPDGGDRRIYKSGDLGRKDEEGLVRHLGRKDFQLKIRGYAVQAGEVEMALRELEAVNEAVVTASEKAPGDRRLVAYVTVTTPAPPTVTELREALAEKLPDYMVPSAFVVLDEFARTATGKLNRRALPEPGTARPNVATAYAAPRTPMEEALAAIWADVLGLEQIGIHDGFLDLGGTSLLAAQVINRIRAELGTDVELRALMETPTVAGQALAVLGAQTGQVDDDTLADLLAKVEDDQGEAGEQGPPPQPPRFG